MIDAVTLHDLDVFSTASSRGPTLWDLVDRTRSHRGREHLRRRLTTPCQTAADILAQQHAHRALGSDLAGPRRLFDAIDSDAVGRYLDATWQLPSAQPMTARVGLWRPPWFAEYLRAVEDGQGRLLAALQGAATLRQRLAATDSPLLRAAADRLASELARPETGSLLQLGSRRSTAGRIAFDALARGDAKPIVTAILDEVGAVEGMWSLAAVTAERGWTYPRPASRLAVEGLYHPFLPPSRGGVANDLRLDDRVRVCVVTGPNMAGKSTFLRAIAIAMLLAHAGCGVPAASMECPTVATIFSSVQIADDLDAGESFYLAEVRRIRALALALREHRSAVAVLDEPFRGTNVHDATEASLAVIARLVRHPAALVFVASHLTEIAAALRDDPGVHFLHFSADLSGERPRFDYRLREGVSAQRLGMTLLRQEQVLDLLELDAAAAGRSDQP